LFYCCSIVFFCVEYTANVKLYFVHLSHSFIIYFQLKHISVTNSNDIKSQCCHYCFNRWRNSCLMETRLVLENYKLFLEESRSNMNVISQLWRWKWWYYLCQSKSSDSLWNNKTRKKKSYSLSATQEWVYFRKSTKTKNENIEEKLQLRDRFVLKMISIDEMIAWLLHGSGTSIWVLPILGIIFRREF
jgi:hypothetical protein